MPEPKCLRCNIELKTLGKETIQLGEYAPFFGHLSNLASGGLDVILRSCPICGEAVVLPADRAGYRKRRADQSLPAVRAALPRGEAELSRLRLRILLTPIRKDPFHGSYS